MSVKLLLFLLLNYGLPLVVLFSIPLFILRRRFLAAAEIFFSGSLSWIIGFLLKRFFYFPRPFILLGRPPDFFWSLDGSFPSNHTAVVIAVSLTVFSLDKKLGFNLMILGLLVAASRVVWNFHSWTDVFAGIVIGLLSSLLITRVFHR